MPERLSQSTIAEILEKAVITEVEASNGRANRSTPSLRYWFWTSPQLETIYQRTAYPENHPEVEEKKKQNLGDKLFLGEVHEAIAIKTLAERIKFLSNGKQLVLTKDAVDQLFFELKLAEKRQHPKLRFTDEDETLLANHRYRPDGAIYDLRQKRLAQVAEATTNLEPHYHQRKAMQLAKNLRVYPSLFEPRAYVAYVVPAKYEKPQYIKKEQHQHSVLSYPELMNLLQAIYQNYRGLDDNQPTLEELRPDMAKKILGDRKQASIFIPSPNLIRI